MSLKKGTDIELTIDSAAFKGKGVGRYEGIAVFVPKTAPGDRVRARIIKKKKRHREAKLLEILEPSVYRIEPRCRHAAVCGGCTWQHLPYERQLEYKEQQVRDHMERIAGLDPGLVEPILGCDRPFYYRNKMEYSFGTRRWLSREEIESEGFVDDRGFAAGLHAPGRYDKILDLQECHLQHPVSYRILDCVRNYCKELGIEAFDTVNNRGYMRHLVIRTSHHTDDLMVNLVTFENRPGQIRALADHLLEKEPSITTIVNNINDQPNPTAVGRYENILHGPGVIEDAIGDYRFRIAPNAFFQTNTAQAERLYEVARRYAEPERHRRLFDLYCGVGTLSLFLSRGASHVVGIELVEEAVRNARENAKSNGVEHVTFYKGDMKDTFNETLLQTAGQPDCIVTDPPRSGMHPDVVRALKEQRVSRLVYVSCNPSTLARDLKELKTNYDVEAIQPVDMFPQTYHIEAVARLTLKSGPNGQSGTST